jgi:hypothetical protein
MAAAFSQGFGPCIRMEVHELTAVAFQFVFGATYTILYVRKV